MRRLLNYILAPFRALVSPFRFLFRWPSRLFGVPAKMLGLSLPARVALVVAVTLCLAVVIYYWCLSSYSERAAWDTMTAWRILIPLVLVLIAFPVMAYVTAKLVLEGPVSAFPDIDKAWEDGLAALRTNSLDLDRLPLFLLVGVREGVETDLIMDASGIPFLVRAVPEGRQPLRWYANERAVFLACPQLGCLSKATSGGHAGVAHPAGQGAPDDLSKTLALDSPPAYAEDVDAMDASASAGEFDASSTLLGTLVAGVRATLKPGSAEPPRGPVAGMRRAEMEQQSRRLEHVGQLLRRARQPFCAFNGMLALIPWRTVEDTAVTPQEVTHAIKLDTQSLQDATQLTFPITVLVTGMETEPGFLELVRRVGHEFCQRRYGKRFAPTNRTTSENMNALAAHVCGVFEGFVYKLFRDPDGLKKPGNPQLYTLLCKVRSRLKSRLRNVLVGFASDTDRRILGGLYFAATGNSADNQCFLKGTIERLLELEEELEWTEDAVRANRRCAGWAEFEYVLSALVAISLAAMLIFKWMQ